MLFRSPSALLLPIWAEGPVSVKEPNRETNSHPAFTIPRLTVASPAHSPEFILQMPRSEHVSLSIQDVTGRRIEQVIEGFVPVGLSPYRPTRTLSPGVYYIRMVTAERAETRKLVVTP